ARAGASQSGSNRALNGPHSRGETVGDVAAETQPGKPLSRTDRDLLAMQLTEARTVAERYPTVQSALDAGYILAGGFAPGSGAHYVKTSGSGFAGQNNLDIEHPGSLIYEGTNPDSKIVGLMYLGFGQGGK